MTDGENQMRGNNILSLNEATMIEVVQYWLDNKALNPQERSPVVKGVKKQANTFDTPVFDIQLAEPTA